MPVKFGIVGGIEPTVCALSGASTVNRHHVAVHLTDTVYVFVNRSVYYQWTDEHRQALLAEMSEAEEHHGTTV